MTWKTSLSLRLENWAWNHVQPKIFAVLPSGWKSPGCWTARCCLYKAPGGFENSERWDKDLEHVNITLKSLEKGTKLQNTDTCRPRRWLISLFSTDKYLNSGSFSKIPVSRELSRLPARLSHDNLDCLLKPDRNRKGIHLTWALIGQLRVFVPDMNSDWPLFVDKTNSDWSMNVFVHNGNSDWRPTYGIRITWASIGQLNVFVPNMSSNWSLKLCL